MNCKRQSHFAKECGKKGPELVINKLRGTKTPQNTKELKGIKRCTVKHFVFYYNNKCSVYKEAKYGISYWPQELSPEQFRDIKEEK